MQLPHYGKDWGAYGFFTSEGFVASDGDGRVRIEAITYDQDLGFLTQAEYDKLPQSSY